MWAPVYKERRQVDNCGKQIVEQALIRGIDRKEESWTKDEKTQELRKEGTESR